MSSVCRGFEILKDHIHSTHVHDNAKDRDSHLWPGDGTIDWKEAMELLRSAPQTPPLLLEIEADEKVNPLGENGRGVRNWNWRAACSGDFAKILTCNLRTRDACDSRRSMSSPVATIAEIGKHEGQTVTIRGWLYNLRESGKLLVPASFAMASGVIQGVVPKNAVSPKSSRRIKGLTQESSVIVEGKVRADKRAPGGYELDVSAIQVVQRVSESDPYPISPKEHGVDFLMEHRHLWLRSPRQAAILRVRAEIIKAARDFFDERGFTLTDPPILTPAACEGTSTLFPVDYFDEQAYLTQSGQLYIEATAMALGKVYSFGPTFRAEKSKTRRHLTEFWMVEPEVAYADSTT